MSAPLLVVDASTYRGTAAIVDAGRVIAETEVRMRGAEEERLMPAVASVLRDAGLEPGAIAGVVCGEGPGSFTSLRIAASIAKGIVTATGRPLLAVSSLLLLGAATPSPLSPGGYLALLDAMRGEWFGARVTVDALGRVLLEGAWHMMNAEEVRRVVGAEDRRAIGPGQPIDASPHARGFVRIASSDGLVREVDAAHWEPSYGRLPEAQARWEQSHGRPLMA